MASKNFKKLIRFLMIGGIIIALTRVLFDSSYREMFGIKLPSYLNFSDTTQNSFLNSFQKQDEKIDSLTYYKNLYLKQKMAEKAKNDPIQDVDSIASP